MSGVIWLASYPKSGNTWLRVFLANLRAGATVPVDINQLDSVHFASRELWDAALGWETTDLTVEQLSDVRFAVQGTLARQAPSPLIKTHERFADLVSGAPRFAAAATRAAIYVVRNPLDVAVSFSHMAGQDLDAIIDFMNDPAAALDFLPQRLQLSQPLGDWSTNVRGWVDAPGIKVTVLRYEDMVAAPMPTFTTAARVFGEPDLVAVQRAIDCSRFQRLQEQELRAGFAERAARRVFFRSGRSGEWRERLSARQVEALVGRHRASMERFGYLGADGLPR